MMVLSVTVINIETLLCSESAIITNLRESYIKQLQELMTLLMGLYSIYLVKAASPFYKSIDYKMVLYTHLDKTTFFLVFLSFICMNTEVNF
jgi:hypothetical protein